VTIIPITDLQPTLDKMPRTTQIKTSVYLCHVMAYSGMEANSAHYLGTVVWFAQDGSHVQPYTQQERRGVLQNQCGSKRITRESNSAHLLRY